MHRPLTRKGNQMPRTALDETHIHSAIRDNVANFGAEIIAEVKAAIAANDFVVVGMKQNPYPKKACKALDKAGIKYTYLEYGSYFGQWRRRLALKMWTGWPTIPMVFVKGVLVGGAQDLERLIAKGEFRK